MPDENFPPPALERQGRSIGQRRRAMPKRLEFRRRLAAAASAGVENYAAVQRHALEVTRKAVHTSHRGDRTGDQRGGRTGESRHRLAVRRPRRSEPGDRERGSQGRDPVRSHDGGLPRVAVRPVDEAHPGKRGHAGRNADGSRERGAARGVAIRGRSRGSKTDRRTPGAYGDTLRTGRRSTVRVAGGRGRDKSTQAAGRPSMTGGRRSRSARVPGTMGTGASCLPEIVKNPLHNNIYTKYIIS